jgi:GT2 family glycosyltransferase
MPPRPRLLHPDHRVTAVLVAHDGARWLPDVLDALSGQTRPPQYVVAVDVGSTDETASLLAEGIGDELVATAPRTTGFGAAVGLGLRHLDGLLAQAPRDRARRRSPDAGPTPEPINWLWLLHDDAAPDADALAALLDVVAHEPSVAVAGPKVLDWDDPRLLVEVGLTVDRAGRRETGLEPRELDQGQHDARRDVLAVGTAGMLVRRDVWDSLGGLDPRYPLFRDDIDLGWRVNAAGHRVVLAPTARIRHARAAATGTRPAPAVHGVPRAVDRRHGVDVVVANSAHPVLLLPRLLLGMLLRTLAFALTRQIGRARDEIAAFAHVVTSPVALARAHRLRRSARNVPPSALRPLFAGTGARLREYAEAAGAWISGGGDRGDGGLGLDAPLDIDPDAEGVAGLDTGADGGGGLARWLLRRPGLLLVFGLLVVALVAERRLLGAGHLVGGDLLPVPDAARDLWRDYAASWHRVGAGTSASAPASAGVLALLGSIALGKAWLALDVLVLGAVPLAGWVAYRASAGAIASRPVRLWAAAAYALLPVATGGIALGRVDVAVALVATPALLAAGYRLLTVDPRYAGWRRAFATGLGLALTTALAPPAWLLGAALLVAGAVVVLLAATPANRVSATRRVTAALIAAATPLAVLVPWSGRLLRSPDLLVAGRQAALEPFATARLEFADLVALRPAHYALPPAWLVAALGLAALSALLVRRAVRPAVAAWLIALAGLAVAIAVARGLGPLPVGYPGVALVLVGAALVLAAGLAADGARERLAGFSFGWRQPLAAAVALAAAVVPVWAAVGWLVRGADGPLHRERLEVLPAAVVAETRRDAGTRVLWLERSGSVVGYDLTDGRGRSFVDADLAPRSSVRSTLNTLVADLTSVRGTSAAEGLAGFAVRYVAVRPPASDDLVGALDAQPGLSRAEFTGDLLLWRTLTPSARVVVLADDAAARARTGQSLTRDIARGTPPAVVAHGREAARGQIPPGSGQRLVVVAEAKDSGWRATVDGKRLAATTAYGWAQAFELPPGGGEFRLRYAGDDRQTALTVQAVLAGLVLILAAPSVRRGDDLAAGPRRAEDEVSGAEPAPVGALP